MFCIFYVIKLSNVPHVVPGETQNMDKSQPRAIRDQLDDLGMIKQVIAKDNPFIINLELPQESELPELPQGMKTNEYVTICTKLYL